MRLGKLDQALSYIVKLIDLKPDYYDAHINLSSIYIEKRQFEDAISILEQTLKFKKTASAMINLSKAYSELGHKHESMRYAYAATELNANDETCFINLANLCLKYESLEQGVRQLKKRLR